MEIKFIIDVDLDKDYYCETYTAEVLTDDGTSFTIQASEDDTSYDGFRSGIFEDLFLSLAEQVDLTVTVDEEDYATIDLEEFEEVEDYTPEPNGC